MVTPLVAVSTEIVAVSFTTGTSAWHSVKAPVGSEASPMFSFEVAGYYNGMFWRRVHPRVCSCYNHSCGPRRPFIQQSSNYNMQLVTIAGSAYLRVGKLTQSSYNCDDYAHKASCIACFFTSTNFCSGLP